MPVTHGRIALKVAVVLISIHSFLLGVAMLLFPRSFPGLFGFVSNGGPFWQSQSGVFLIVLAIAYFLAYKELDKSRLLVIYLVTSKTFAVAFLLTQFIFFHAPYAIILAAIGDGFMGALVYVLHKQSPLATAA
jgi:hypothetical protein